MTRFLFIFSPNETELPNLQQFLYKVVFSNNASVQKTLPLMILLNPVL